MVRRQAGVAVAERTPWAGGVGDRATVLCAAVLARVCVELLEGGRGDDVSGADADVYPEDERRDDRHREPEELYAEEYAGGRLALSPERAGGGRGATAIYAALPASGG